MRQLVVICVLLSASLTAEAAIFKPVCDRSRAVTFAMEEALTRNCRYIGPEQVASLDSLDVVVEESLLAGDFSGLRGRSLDVYAGIYDDVTVESGAFQAMHVDVMTLGDFDALTLAAGAFRDLALSSLNVETDRLIVDGRPFASVQVDAMTLVVSATSQPISGAASDYLSGLEVGTLAVVGGVPFAVPALYFSGLKADTIDLAQVVVNRFDPTALERATVGRVILTASTLTDGERQALRTAYPAIDFVF
jgi:hypothetical protein